MTNLAGAEPSSAPRELEYAYPNQSVWTTRLNEQGEPDNPLLRLAEVLFAKAGIRWHGQSYPATRMFENLRNGTSEFSMLVESPLLKDCCIRSQKPVARAEVRVFRKPDKTPIKTKDDLIGKSIITIRGYSYGGLMGFLADEKNRITNNVSTRHEDAFEMLKAGRADYLLDYSQPAAEVLQKNPIQGLKSEIISHQDVYLILSKTYPNAEKTMSRLEVIASGLDVDRITGMKMK